MFFKFLNPETHHASAYALLEGTGEVSDHKCTSASQAGAHGDMPADSAEGVQSVRTKIAHFFYVL